MDSIIKETYKIEGMSCASCAMNIETTLKKQKGINYANVNFAGSNALIEFDADVISLEKIAKRVDSIGYKIIIDKYVKNKTEGEESLKLKKNKKQNLLCHCTLAACCCDQYGLSYNAIC